MIDKLKKYLLALFLFWPVFALAQSPPAPSSQTLINGYAVDNNVSLCWDATHLAMIVCVQSPTADGSTNVETPDKSATGLSLNSATANAAITVPVNNRGTTSFVFTGLTASGATLTFEASDNGGTTWASINCVGPTTGSFSSTANADGQCRTNSSGRTAVRARVSTTGTGTITVSWNSSVVSGLIALSAPAPVIPSVTHGKAYLALAANTSTALSSATPASWSGSLTFPLSSGVLSIQSISANTASTWLCNGGGTCALNTYASPNAEDEIQAGGQWTFNLAVTQSASPTVISSVNTLLVITW